ncbi:hypothetical protein B0H17DRAFT_1146160 [Mycena rosella]|uniref:Uncharacterized protein n=1 Tax=Mycena rosella TaxID=1033263 RepID=A0AAD7CRX3_MYCRO|nr:hypothetical protein B0H17DRAFT_1146160 [Mycena rosella]
MSTHITHQETRRLFGPVNRPDFKINVRQHAVLHKAIEIVHPDELQAVFGQPTRLQVGMGTGLATREFGKIKSNFMHNGTLVSRQNAPPPGPAQQALCAYLAAYDTYFMKPGNDYRVRNANAISVLQDAEQAWHDWVVPYLATRNMPGRSPWALQPLPGLQMVRRAPRAALPAPSAPRHARAPSVEAAPAPSTPRRTRAPGVEATPAPSTPRRVRAPGARAPNIEAASAPSTPHCARAPVGSRLRPIVFHDNDGKDTPRRPEKRKLLGVIDISDSEEEEAARPPKRLRSLGVVDLTD